MARNERAPQLNTSEEAPNIAGRQPSREDSEVRRTWHRAQRQLLPLPPPLSSHRRRLAPHSRRLHRRTALPRVLTAQGQSYVDEHGQLWHVDAPTLLGVRRSVELLVLRRASRPHLWEPEEPGELEPWEPEPWEPLSGHLRDPLQARVQQL
ncbi:uncharacterized protein LOC106702576 [Latimeria chalumnae]|uniref:uncharacterized protein LOC106702576 n=1 Tax=Latimeria chalumnae TaxID=7897 RepID=UPI0006D915FD|nr:PREDICTED: uncharacterized protein LOC106702576 [Latimeria chalumnae]|eukprot:XP_014340788.1 PREDICTED: uncharacterized protein LOC106702576 [Latimeria chalumnae]